MRVHTHIPSCIADHTPSASKVPDYKSGYEGTTKCLNESLTLLQVGVLQCQSVHGSIVLTSASLADYLDLYLIHKAPVGTAARLDTWKALIDAKKSGKVRSIGVSN